MELQAAGQLRCFPLQSLPCLSPQTVPHGLASPLSLTFTTIESYLCLNLYFVRPPIETRSDIGKSNSSSPSFFAMISPPHLFPFNFKLGLYYMISRDSRGLCCICLESHVASTVQPLCVLPKERPFSLFSVCFVRMSLYRRCDFSCLFVCWLCCLVPFDACPFLLLWPSWPTFSFLTPDFSRTPQCLTEISASLSMSLRLWYR